MKKIEALPMRSPVPADWISEAEVIAATGASPRNLTEWRGRGIVTGRRRHLGRGAGTTPCFYPSDTIRLIQRLYELQRTVRDADRWVWQLWPEGFSADVFKWAKKRLQRELKLANNAGKSGIAKAAAEAATMMPAPSDPARSIFDRIRKPEDRQSLFSYVGAAFAGVEQQASIHSAEPPILDILLKAMGIARSTLVLRSDLDRVSVGYLYKVLDTASPDEREQARRDWKAISHLIEALETVDWNAAASELEPKIEALTNSKPEPPSKRQRKARRQRPLKSLAIADVFLKGLSDLESRPHLLAAFIAIRRSSPENSAVCSQALALAESLISHLPQREIEVSSPGDMP